ncbi:MAG: CHAT domain-containing tetratricopeptide repeat protein [Bacteroidota bacterium]|nr:CHAT domain-containing tetratricopeptide repeat protein [Bacteroidota bacterium]
MESHSFMPIFIRRCLLPSIIMLGGLLPMQTRGQEPDYLRKYREAERYYSAPTTTPRTDSLALAGYRSAIVGLENGGPAELLIDCYQKAGILEMTGGRDQAAIGDFLRSIRHRFKPGTPVDSLLFKSYLYAGSCYYNLYDLDSASWFYKQAEGVIEAYPRIPESERLYNKSGALYYETGDYRRSILYFNKALALVNPDDPQGRYFIVNYKNNIATALRGLQDYDQAIALYKSLLPYHINQNELLHNIGATYLEAGHPPEAIHYLTLVGYNDQIKYNHLAGAHIRLGQYAEAANDLQRALSAYSQPKMPQKSQDLCITLKYLGDLCMAKDSPMPALRYYQQAIIQADRDFNDSAISHNPSSFYGLHSSFLLFDVLLAKAAAFKAAGKGVDAFAAYASALTLVRHVERMYNSDEAKLFLVKKAGAAYQQAVDLGFQLYAGGKVPGSLERIFQFMEDNKSSVLQGELSIPEPNLVDAGARDMARQVKEIQSTMVSLNIRLSRTSEGPAAGRLQDSMRELGLRISALQDKLEASPEYYRLKFHSNGPTIAQIQRDLSKDDAALLSYYYTADKLYCFYITAERSGCVAAERPPAFKEHILSLRKELDAGEEGEKGKVNAFIGDLSAQLIAPIFEKIRDKRRLVVIPFNEIAYIPFELLQIPSTGRILIHDFAISYNYSANFLIHSSARGKESYRVLAMAPFAEKTPAGRFSRLPTSGSEVTGLPGSVLLDREATKMSFMSLSPNYPIVHLATHAVANDLDPTGSFIAFYDPGGTTPDTLSRLYEEEIAHLDLHSLRLVILSACETGKGQVINGEGIISLSRAFSYAGSRSIMTTLWRADDSATSIIARRVHAYLQAGEPADEALRKAKLDYLNDPDIEARFKHPSYWAPLVLVGDFHAVGEQRHGRRLLLEIGILLAAILLCWPLFRVAKKNRVRRNTFRTRW